MELATGRSRAPVRECGADSPAGARSLGCTLAAYARAKALPEAFLQTVGVSEIRHQGVPALRIPYRDGGGAEPGIRLRLAIEKNPARDDRFRWKTGSKPLLYGLWRLRREPSVVIVEGESDCHTLWHHGINAVGLPGAANGTSAATRPPCWVRDHIRRR